MDAPPKKVRKIASFGALRQSIKSNEQLPVELDDDFLTPAFSADPLQLQGGETHTFGAEEKRQQDRQNQQKLAAKRALEKAHEVQLPQLSSPEDLLADLALQRHLRLRSAVSLRFLRLPPALRCGAAAAFAAPAREEALELLAASLPHLPGAQRDFGLGKALDWMSQKDRAVAWLGRIASSLSWHEADGPPNKQTNEPPDEKVKDWDEAYRSLWVLLRQGVLQSFSMESERFTVTVFGEGTGPWTAGDAGDARGAVRPSSKEPCAVVWPSTRELRGLLQEEQAPFSVPKEQMLGLEEAVSDQTLAELRELRRDGIKASTPEVRNALSTAALWFQGPWRVQCLMDVLRQYFLGQPSPGFPPPPQHLPKLFATGPFVNSTVKSAQVVKIAREPGRTDPGEHMAELRGRFFPLQLRKFLELLRVSLPKFSCELLAPNDCAGLNSFTQLGQHRIEAVSCERSSDNWRWSFQLSNS
ncbi:unnamed protein product [Effrenium voratum]|uniref:Uncharacterized protein n=1 Tax=Effrenium voratum TaxID=2562239 RepID=A0AA36MUY6_9DINO|nr:unnamed protein product [Effrenium voratum]